MKPIETAEQPAKQSLTESFQASVLEAWGVWKRMLNNDFLQAAFTRREDALAFADKHAGASGRGEVRKMWVIVNETLGEAYALSGNASKPLQCIDLDFGQRTQLQHLRRDLMARLSDEELAALGVQRR